MIIQGLEYTLPKRPPLSEIRGYGLPKRRQVWTRDTTYEQWDWNMDEEEGPLWFNNPAPGQLEWYEGMLNKMHNGEWIFIDGEPTYINKYCYFYHQWYIHQGGYYSEFRDTSLEFFRFWEIVEKDPFSLGMVGIKGRRLGMSSMAASVHLLYALTEENNLQGIVSKTAQDAKEMYLMVKNALESLPPFLMPQLRNVGEKELHLDTPRERVSKNNQKIIKGKGLNNRINWLAPAENAYDGRELRFLVVDESGKWEGVDVSMFLSKVSNTLITGSTVIGKVMMFSTVNAPDKGGANFENIWRLSDHTDKERVNEYGQTSTKLKRFFIPGYKGVQGYIDWAGRSVVDTPTKEQSEYLSSLRHPKTGNIICLDPKIGSKEFREKARKLVEKNPELLAEEKRMFPFTWEEAFDSANTLCIFDIENILERERQLKDKLVELGRDPDKGELGRRGWFYKLDNDRVIFKDDPEGLWYIDTLLSEEESNKFNIISGKKVPTNEEFGAAGLDPIRAGDTTVDKGSDACCIIRSRYSSTDPDNTGKPVAMFLGRPNDSRKFHEQIYNGLQYYGVKMLAERAPLNWLDYAEDNGLTGYLYGTKRSDGTEVKGIPNQQSEATKQEHAEVQVLSSLSDWDKIPFMRLIKDRKDFKVNDRTKYDACMADGYALMALKIPFKKLTKTLKETKFVFKGKVTSL